MSPGMMACAPACSCVDSVCSNLMNSELMLKGLFTYVASV